MTWTARIAAYVSMLLLVFLAPTLPWWGALLCICVNSLAWHTLGGVSMRDAVLKRLEETNETRLDTD